MTCPFDIVPYHVRSLATVGAIPVIRVGVQAVRFGPSVVEDHIDHGGVRVLPNNQDHGNIRC